MESSLQMGKCISKELEKLEIQGDLSVEECYKHMHNGTKLQKAPGFTSIDKKNLQKKTLLLDEDKRAIRYFPTKKGINFKIPIKSIKKIYASYPIEVAKPNQISEDLIFAFTYRQNSKPHDENAIFVAPNEKVKNLWIKGIHNLMKNADHAFDPFDKLPWLQDAFKVVDKDDNGALTLSESKALLSSLNIHCPDGEIKRMFSDSNKDGEQSMKKGKLTKEEILTFMEPFLVNDVMVDIFKKYGKKTLDADNFRKFLVNEQLFDVEIERAIKIMQSSRFYQEGKEFTYQGFLEYIFSPQNSIFDTRHNNIHQDMTKPMSYYFINSSHNTYLMSDQLRGTSSVQAYINALKKGCRCVELDCWDGDDGEPIIYHGNTFTSKILFKDVIEGIAKHAFDITDYPLILSFENHCSLPQQVKMAEYLKKGFQETLFIDEIDPKLEALPSPESLKGKVICKGKKLPPHIECQSSIDEEDLYVTIDIDDKKNDEMKDRKVSKHVQNGKVGDESTDESDSSVKKKKEKKIKLAPEFSNLVNYIQGVHFPGVKEALNGQEYYKMSSINETKVADLTKAHRGLFCKYHKKFLTRTYPAGKRVDSSNYNPLIGWAAGCQIVALNFQTDGLMMDIYESMFRMNGSSGYVLKPPCLIDDEITYDPESAEENDGIEMVNVEINVISGHFLPKTTSTNKDIIDSYVAINIYGVKDDNCVNKFRTKTVSNNGFNPYWNYTFQFLLRVPDLAFVRFVVYDEDVGVDDFVAQSTIPFSAMNRGYRNVPLMNHKGHELPHAKLLVQVKKRFVSSII